jgi:hypothetical protein
MRFEPIYLGCYFRAAVSARCLISTRVVRGR